MNKIKIAIVGRPNVGKSALFNRICQKKIAIVDEQEGVTRDRLYQQIDFFGTPIEVIDTGGIDAKGDILFFEEVKRQAEIAIEEADSIVMVVDGRIGLTQLDEEVAKILHQTHKPIALAINKIDDPSKKNLIHDFHQLGIPKMVGISANHGHQIVELFEKALEDCPKPEEDSLEESGIKVAIVGRTNVGKSTLINHILNEERCVVSPIPGTTMDHIDVKLTVDDKDYIFIDTAGIRRKSAEHEVVDKFAAIRTDRAIERADVCILVLDSQSGMTHQEKRIATKIEEEGKGCILLFNKWDLIKGFRMEHCLQGIRQEASFLNYCPAIFASAKTGKNIPSIFKEIQSVHKAMHERISTGQLNKFIEKALQNYHPPMIKGKRLRIYYLTQVAISPPRFLLFVNQPKLMIESYKRYLMNQFRKVYKFPGCPLKIDLRGKLKRGESKTQSRAKKEAPEIASV